MASIRDKLTQIQEHRQSIRDLISISTDGIVSNDVLYLAGIKVPFNEEWKITEGFYGLIIHASDFFDVIEVRFEKGAHVDKHFHPQSETFIVVDGEVELTYWNLDNEPITEAISANHSVSSTAIAGNTPHELTAKTDGRFISVLSPPIIERRTHENTI